MSEYTVKKWLDSWQVISPGGQAVGIYLDEQVAKDMAHVLTKARKERVACDFGEKVIADTVSVARAT